MVTLILFDKHNKIGTSVSLELLYMEKETFSSLVNKKDACAEPGDPQCGILLGSVCVCLVWVSVGCFFKKHVGV